ncbi:hypothetical protein A3D71_02385 [Candidatus Kaiserbacteria bacterium RIFCSPHIGHO2_02_FULL_55_20]|uniref:General secretion pathway protein GspM n=1 Tax=Candidatus Kaiserbacteria bacterium RIFCSPHIGHO2_02_FULL_55_20 TaxID=1798497 RepID=A0A1F6DY95_9BACT|nr:MAG: hypothetical protein A2680_04050 [Candidatus Kaiserbacteria bacterium RIFCSPHIGHO2_01_FULL_55_37]OGG66366.1 MAG: hypothetical protein A3D71_02385 [Candidatus Kaiserbacteria bacterium RIFCSPHIGHO2_02_FULL_55_20]
MLYRTLPAFLVLTLAVVAWGLVALFAWTISVDEAARSASAGDEQKAVITNAAALRMHTLAQETAGDGETLKKLLNVDVVSASYMIEEVGKIAGVAVKLSDAQPENTQSTDASGPKAVGFVVAADGKFPALMHAARLFETLPVPSSVTRLDIERTPQSSGKPSGLWHMNVYIRALTTSDI